MHQGKTSTSQLSWQSDEPLSSIDKLKILLKKGEKVTRGGTRPKPTTV
jgi:hypothetical protein